MAPSLRITLCLRNPPSLSVFSLFFRAPSSYIPRPPPFKTTLISCPTLAVHKPSTLFSLLPGVKSLGVVLRPSSRSRQKSDHLCLARDLGGEVSFPRGFGSVFCCVGGGLGGSDFTGDGIRCGPSVTSKVRDGFGKVLGGSDLVSSCSISGGSICINLSSFGSGLNIIGELGGDIT